jgi:aminoglycoside phosphotransferase (APT) family kinase protein
MKPERDPGRRSCLACPGVQSERMNQPWTAEFEVSPTVAMQLIQQQFPALAPVRIEPFGVGWDNVAFLVNGVYVFRFPRRELGARLLNVEMKLMPHLAPKLPLRVPDHAFQGTPTEQFHWSFAGYGLIPGRTACRAKLSDVQRLALAPKLGQFLGALHALPAPLERELGAAPDPMGRFDMTRRIQQTREKIAYLVEHRLFDQTDELLAILDTTPSNYLPRSDVLVHGDLYSRHLIVDEAGGLTGVIDWGDIHLADPAADLMIGWTLLPPAARKPFFSIYGHVDESTWIIARFRALNHTANVIPYAHQTHDAHLLRESVQSLRNLTLV